MAIKSTTRVEIYDQVYPIGGNADAASVQRLAARVDAKMRQVARETRVVDSLRVAVLAAMNLADESEALRLRCERLERLVGEKSRHYHQSLDRVLSRTG